MVIYKCTNTLDKQSNQNSQQNQQANNEEVIVTEKGKKYHRSDCRALEKSKTQRAITKQETENQGYTSCQVCR